MERLLVILSAAIIGGALGIVMNRLPFHPVVRSLSAALVGWLLASLLIAAFLVFRSVENAGIGSATVGLAELLIRLALVLTVGGVLHVVFGWLGTRLFPALVAYRTVVIGLLGGAAAGVVSMWVTAVGR